MFNVNSDCLHNQSDEKQKQQGKETDSNSNEKTRRGKKYTMREILVLLLSMSFFYEFV